MTIIVWHYHNSELGLWGLLSHWVNIFLIASSFLSMKLKKFTTTREQWLSDGSDDEAALSFCLCLNPTYWLIIRSINRTSAMTEMTLHERYRPQKLIKWSWSGLGSLFRSPGQPILQNHFSCIFWSSPLSASFRIAVDMSSARGESLWKAW